MRDAERRVRHTKNRGYELRLADEEREVLRSLPEQLRDLLADDDDPVLARLFPEAYRDDPEHEAEFQSLVRSDLVGERLENLEVMERTLDAEQLNEEEAAAWLSGVNDARLVLGTRLDVTEELNLARISQDDPNAPLYALYAFLTWFEEQLVAALAD
jgi:uncharacterized protein DUF2017